MRLSRYAQCYVALCSLFDDRPSCPMRAEYGHGSQITLSSNVGPMVLFYYYLTLPSGGSSVTESMLMFRNISHQRPTAPPSSPRPSSGYYSECSARHGTLNTVMHRALTTWKHRCYYLYLLGLVLKTQVLASLVEEWRWPSSSIQRFQCRSRRSELLEC